MIFGSYQFAPNGHFRCILDLIDRPRLTLASPVSRFCRRELCLRIGHDILSDPKSIYRSTSNVRSLHWLLCFSYKVFCGRAELYCSEIDSSLWQPSHYRSREQEVRWITTCHHEFPFLRLCCSSNG